MKKNILLSIGLLGLCGQISAMETQSVPMSVYTEADLLIAAERGAVKDTRKIIEENGLDLQEVMKMRFGNYPTLLAHAADNGHASVIGMLTLQGANKSIVDHRGKDALWYANERHKRIVEMLSHK